MGREEIREPVSEYPNSGVLNPNKFFREGSKMPTHNGRGKVTCKHCQCETEFEIAAWRRNGGKLITLAFTEKELAEKKRADAKAKKAALERGEEPTDTNQSEFTPGQQIF
jgi:hypothetical protein